VQTPSSLQWIIADSIELCNAGGDSKAKTPQYSLIINHRKMRLTSFNNPELEVKWKKLSCRSFFTIKQPYCRYLSHSQRLFVATLA
jgi:hypothetical protein